MAQIEAHQLGVVNIDFSNFNLSIQALLSFHDKNHEEGIPIYSFWPQRLVNKTW